MSRNVTLSTLREDIRLQADIVGATTRHTSAQLTRLINQSIQAFREDVSNEGNTHYLVSTSGTLSVGATSPHGFQILDVSAVSPAVVRTYGLDVTIDGTVVSLEHRPFVERTAFGGPNNTGQPCTWAHYQTAKIAIQPPPDQAYSYTLWYLPVLADLSADADTFDGVAGWEMWIVWDVVLRLLIRDQQSTAYQTAKAERDAVTARIKAQATRVSQAGGAVVGRDTFGKRLPDFLGGRRALVAASGGPSTPPEDSVTNAMLVERTGPIVLGVPTGTGNPIDWHVASLTSYLVQFNSARQGVVPQSGGLSTEFIAGDGVWRTPAGGSASGLTNDQLAPVPPLTVKGNSSTASGTVEDLTGDRLHTVAGLHIPVAAKLLWSTASGKAGTASGLGVSASGARIDVGAIAHTYSGIDGGAYKNAIFVSFNSQSALNSPTAGAFRIFYGAKPVLGGQNTTNDGNMNILTWSAWFTEPGRLTLGDVLSGGGGTTPNGVHNIHLGATGAVYFDLGGAEEYAFGATGTSFKGNHLNMEAGDIVSPRRIAGLDLTRVFGDLAAGGSSSGSASIHGGSGTAFIIPSSETVGQKYQLMGTGANGYVAEQGEAILIQNRSSATHIAYNAGASSGIMKAIRPSGAAWFAFASGVWSFQTAYRLGGF